jgi:hypothetical protein
MNPYIQFQPMQDQQGLAPVFQNISAQQAMQNAALNEQNQQVQQAGIGGQGGGAGANQLAMAMALRKKSGQPETMGGHETPNWSNPYANYSSGADFGSSGIE